MRHTRPEKTRMELWLEVQQLRDMKNTAFNEGIPTAELARRFFTEGLARLAKRKAGVK